MPRSVVHRLTDTEPGFPRRLREARAVLPRLPSALDVVGEVPDTPVAVAIVGSRAAYARDTELAAELARAVVRRGGVVVSGGAIGIDTAAHRGAIDAGGPTVAVLGTGIDVVYPPRNVGLFDAIARAGALVSSFPRGARPRGYHFIARNTVIAALADLVVVVGASGRSGSLHTAAAARRLGRTLAAVPGAEGADRLLGTGAAVVTDAADLERALDGEPRRAVAAPPAAGTPAGRLFDALSEREPRDLEDLADRTGISVRDAQRALAELELDGLVLLAPGQAYLRTSLVAPPA